MGSIRTGRLIHLDEHRRAELNEVGRAEHDRYVVTETHDGTLVLSPRAWVDRRRRSAARPTRHPRTDPPGPLTAHRGAHRHDR